MDFGFYHFGGRRGVTVVGWVLMLLFVCVVLGAGFGVMGWMMGNPVEADKVEKEVMVPRVETVVVRAEDYGVRIATQGEVVPVTETVVVSEVGGAVVMDDEAVRRFGKLKAGGEFAGGEVMVKLARGDYEASVADAESMLRDAELAVVQERARASQARRDWAKLGRGGEPSELVLRVPQLKSAEAKVKASGERLAKAKRDLEKTVIRAPYACRVSEAFVASGGFVAAGGRIARVYGAEAMELRLPLSLEDVGFLPEDVVGTVVEVVAELGGRRFDWSGKVVRTEGAVDRETLTMMTVVRVDAMKEGGMFRLPPMGLFVKGEFVGRELKGVVRLPREALRGGDEVWVVRDGKLMIGKVVVERTERGYVVVSEGLGDGDEVIVSPIEMAIEGMAVKAVEREGLE